jgi:hypothetical protein
MNETITAPFKFVTKDLPLTHVSQPKYLLQFLIDYTERHVKWLWHVLAVLGMAAETNRLAEALRVPIDQGL